MTVFGKGNSSVLMSQPRKFIVIAISLDWNNFYIAFAHAYIYIYITTSLLFWLLMYHLLLFLQNNALMCFEKHKHGFELIFNVEMAHVVNIIFQMWERGINTNMWI